MCGPLESVDLQNDSSMKITCRKCRCSMAEAPVEIARICGFTPLMSDQWLNSISVHMTFKAYGPSTQQR